MKAAAIAAISSGQGKTLLTIAMLKWLKDSGLKVRPFKVGPDYIDTKFHEQITSNTSINLDLFMANPQEMKQTFAYYVNNCNAALIEGVMGYYDGLDYSTSTYNVTKELNIPVILIISAAGSYVTLIPIIKGIIEYKKDHTIKGIVLNNVSSVSHYNLIAERIKEEIPQVELLGWMKKNLDSISSRHLGLDLTELSSKDLEAMSAQVMENINKEKLLNLMNYAIRGSEDPLYEDKNTLNLMQYCSRSTLTIVHDQAFSFLYPQNWEYLEKIYNKINIISGLKNENIPQNTDMLYIPGGYVETKEFAPILNNAKLFKQSLKEYSKSKNNNIYAECAGLMFLGKNIQTTYKEKISGAAVLNIDFNMQKSRTRLGYYNVIDNNTGNTYKGHSFHYSLAIPDPKETYSNWKIYKNSLDKAQPDGWTTNNGNVIGTYLHTFFYNQPELVKNYLIPRKVFQEL